MSRKEPKKSGWGGSAQHLGETWLEAEELAYPHGSLARSQRYALARDQRGKLVRVKVGIPDTMSTIPARGAQGAGTLYVGEDIEGKPEFRFVSRKAARKKYGARERMKERREATRLRLGRYMFERGVPYEEAFAHDVPSRYEGPYGMTDIRRLRAIRERARKTSHTRTR